MAIDERTLGVIEAFYQAAMDEARWVVALETLADYLGSQAGTFWVLSPSPQPQLPTFRFLNFDPAGMKYYLDHMIALDPTNRYLVTHPHEPIIHDGMVISEREKDRDPYYDWQCSLSDARYRMVGQARPAPSLQAGVALHRTRKAGRFEPDDIEKFAFVHRHLSQALAIGFRLGTLGTMRACTEELLDRSPAAILLLDERKHVVFVNRAARELEAERDGVSITLEGVALSSRLDNDRLQRVIAQAFTGLPAAGVTNGHALRAARPSGKRPYTILVGPVSAEYSALSTVRPAVCVVIADPDRATPHLKMRLKSAYGLTEAEARLAALLADGEKLRIAADKLGITYGTCRSRLADIFEKTATRSQPELVALMLKTLAV